MKIEKAEARATLDEIDSLINATKQRIAHGPTGPILVVWGIVWSVVFLGTHFYPQSVSWLPPIGCLVGFASMWVFKGSPQIETKGGLGSQGARIRYAWLVLCAFSFLWILILHPLRPPSSSVPETIDIINRTLAFFASIGMFGYVVAGLWLGRFWITLGLSVTLLIAVGLFALPQWFLLWMAVVGGGSLMFSGLMIKRLWAV